MQSFFKIWVLCICILFGNNVFSQKNHKLEYEAQKSFVIEQSIEMIAENSESEDADYTTLFDLLSIFYDRPINLNHKEIKSDLQQIRLLSDFQINNLLSHVEKNGKLMSIYELQSIDGFDPQTIRNLMPFVSVNTELYSPHISIDDMLKSATNEVFIRYSRVLEDQEGFYDQNRLTELYSSDAAADSAWKASPNRRALGSQDKLYMRYRFKFLTNLSIGLTMEKDAGESFFGNKKAEELFAIKSKKGFDYYSAHFYIKNIGKIKGLAIGDYHVQFGQGLTFWSGLAFGKSTNILSTKRNALGIRPYASVDENRFLRGAAATVGLGKFEFTAFGSRKKIDANINNEDTLSTIDGPNFTSFQATGLHTTVSELEDKDAIEETHMGGHARFITRKLSIGITGAHSIYGGNLERTLQYHNQFDFNSNLNTVMGADYSLLHQNFNFFGEVSRSANGGMAQIHGMLASLDPKLAFSVLYRNYEKDYQSLLSTAFAESGRNANEKGVFIGLEAKPTKYWIITAYADQFSFPWMQSQTDQPNTGGADYILQTRYKPSRDLDMYVRVRNRNKPKNTTEDLDDIDFTVRVNQWNIRYNIIYKISESVRLRNRIEYTIYKRGENEREQGSLIYQDVMYKPKSSPLSFSFRYALFDTDSYNSRIFSYENDVLYFFNIPAYSNRGTRTYLTARYKVRRGIEVWLRWSQWYYNNVNVIGSGQNEIVGNTKTEIRAQVRFKF